MNFETWHLWIVAAIVFFILEIFIPSFLMASIGIGCLFAFLGAVFHAPVALQIILFIAGTLTGFIGVKPLMTKYAYQKKAIITNAGGLVGRIGKVTEEINERGNTGLVAIDGDVWKSISVSGAVIEAGEKVRVVDINSIILTVEPLEQNLSEQNSGVEIPAKTESERLAIKLGKKTFFIGLEEIGFLYSSSKITYVVTNAGKQFIHEKSLDSLNDLLPTELFFRANRQFIVTRTIISEIKTDSNGKLQVQLKVSNGFPNELTISRLKASAFREWLKPA